MRVTSVAAVIVLAFLSAATCEAQRRAWMRQDSWYRPPPRAWGRDVAMLDPPRVTPVPKAKFPLVQAILRDTSMRRLSAAEASGLVGVALLPGPGMNFYILRAVYLNELNGRYEVRQSGTELEVHHGSLGSHALPMQRGAVIVQLTTEPTKVYVTCSMAE